MTATATEVACAETASLYWLDTATNGSVRGRLYIVICIIKSPARTRNSIAVEIRQKKSGPGADQDRCMAYVALGIIAHGHERGDAYT